MSSAVAEQIGLEVATPDCEKGLGKVILAPDSQDLIPGVRIQPYKLWPDDRGYFLEVARIGQGLVADYPTQQTQVSTARARSRNFWLSSRCVKKPTSMSPLGPW